MRAMTRDMWLAMNKRGLTPLMSAADDETRMALLEGGRNNEWPQKGAGVYTVHAH